MTADAFKQTYLPYHPTFYRIAYRMLGNAADAEDMVQDLYVRLWNARSALEKVQNAEAYGVTLIRNRCIDRLRSAGYRVGREAVTSPSAPLANDQDAPLIDSQDDLRIIRQLADHLPDRQKEIFELRYFRDLSPEEIEKVTGLSAGNVRVLLHRARTTVTEQFNQLNTPHTL